MQQSTNCCLLLYHFETVTYRRSGQTLHAGESSMSLVASISSLTSLSSISLCTSRALNESNRRSVNTRLEQYLKSYYVHICY